MLVAAYVQTIASVLGIIVAVAGVVLAVIGIRIARQTARDQQANREFPSDKAYADEFAERMRPITGQQFIYGGMSVDAPTTALRVACQDYADHVTDAGLAIALYFNARQARIAELAGQRLTEPQENVEALRVAIDALLIDMAHVGRDWVYPERRQAVREHIEPVINPKARPVR